MRPATAGRQTFTGTTSSTKTPNNSIRKEAMSASRLRHGEEDNDKDSKVAASLNFATLLKTCAKKKDLYQGSRLHANISDKGLLADNTFLGDTLVSMYAKCGALVRAQQVIDELSIRNVVSWNALILGYVQHGQGKEALVCFLQMRSESLSPNSITYACILKACGIVQEANIGEHIHCEIICQGLLENDIVLGNALVDMYAKYGVFSKAQKVLHELPIRNTATWNALIARYVQQGHGKEALGCFRQMEIAGLSPDAITYTCILQACGISQKIGMGKKIHDEIVSQRLLDKNIVLGNALVSMYVKCRSLTRAKNVLSKLPNRNIVSWNALIAGYVQQGQCKEALGCFQRMQSEGLSPDTITYACILQACGTSQDIDLGKQIHDEIDSEGLFDKNVLLGNALVDMYAKCGAFTKAQNLFDKMPVRDVISWNALIAGYAQHGHGQEALGCFERMRSEGFSPNAVTYTCILKVCALKQEVNMGKQIHDEIASQGLLGKDVVLGNALVDMYAKCGVFTKAQDVLDGLPIRDVVSWNSLIAGYVQQDQGQEALGCFQQMRNEGLSPDSITYACILKACGLTQVIDVGKKIHEEIVSQRFLENNIVLSSALVDMYAKCGVFMRAQQVLDELPVRDEACWCALIAGYAQQGHGEEALGCFQRMRSEGFSPDVVSWSALIGGYAQQGLAKEALNCFHLMQQEGIPPNAITFVNVLTACSHSGLVDEGRLFFDSMRGECAITPDLEHYTCMVELFGRAKLLDKAMRVIEMIPSSVYAPVWSALLGACRKWGNAKLGRLAFEHAVQ